VDEWRANPHSRLKAVCAIAQADIMAERMFNYLRATSSTSVSGMKRPADYRLAIRARHPDLGVLWDAHDTHKHGPLTSHAQVRLITAGQELSPPRASVIGAYGRLPYSRGPYSSGAAGKPMSLVLDDGTHRALDDVLRKGVEAWEIELAVA